MAIVYWGAPRALCSTNPSHRLHLYAPLEARGAAVRVYAHQFYRRDGTAGIWGGAAASVGRPSSHRARDARLDAQEVVARCLAPNASRNVVVEEQDSYFAALNMSRYYGMSNRERITARGYDTYSKHSKRFQRGWSLKYCLLHYLLHYLLCYSLHLLVGRSRCSRRTSARSSRSAAPLGCSQPRWTPAALCRRTSSSFAPMPYWRASYR